MILAPLFAALLLGAAGDPATGRALFSGARPFQQAGPPCGACHALAGEGMAFTASLGPELASGLAGMDAEALDGLLETLPFPTMTPAYEGRALTPGERADLAAYLVPAALKGPPPASWSFEVLGLAGSALVFLAVALAARRRKPSSRERLLRRAVNPQGGSR